MFSTTAASLKLVLCLLSHIGVCPRRTILVHCSPGYDLKKFLVTPTFAVSSVTLIPTLDGVDETALRGRLL